MVTRDAEEGAKKLGFSRAYSLALAPHLIYARSNLLPAIVSSRTHNQLDFQAVGSWFTVTAPSDGQARLTRVPSGREDVFRDDSLDLRAKRSLMKFLRFVSSYDEDSERQRMQDVKDLPFAAALRQHFGLNSTTAVAPLLALALPQGIAAETTMASAVPRIARHLRSIGMFGPGFSAVLPKWGGLAEIAQVACRACAVGGGVYVLGKGVESSTRAEDSRLLRLRLSGGEKGTTEWLVGCSGDLPVASRSPVADEGPTVAKGIYIVSSPLTQLFPPTSEGGVTPAGAVVWIDLASSGTAPVRILAHSSESGECPPGQCVLYASVTADHAGLDAAVNSLLESMGEQSRPEVLWRMHYTHRARQPAIATPAPGERVLLLPAVANDVVLEDRVLEDVERAWRNIMGDEQSGGFLKFEAREGLGVEDVG
ncbi:Rab proteins geranylgeranyltransferase component A [Teratosphaeriaceae sp. CCFEE 6253]|nr:Rab proteins geranylgeranyltransferase component A [Teratosphaeriaceae sp. CCFEE 6253]